MTGIRVFVERESMVYVVAIVASLLLSLGIGYRESVINPDAICYLLSAESVGSQGIRGAMQLCGQAKWPFYSVLIFGFVQLTHFSYLVSAYLIDALCSALSVFMFIRIVKELGGSLSVLWLAAGVILLSHEFNSVREYIIRDHGFWAFYLSSLYFLLRFFRTPTVFFALAWSASLFIATLFRIEGAIFLLTLPFLVLFHTRYGFATRVKYFFLLNAPILLVGGALGGWLLLHPQETLDKLGRVSEVTTQLQQGWHIMTARYDATRNAMVEHVLLPESAHDAGLVLFLVLIVWYLVSVISNVSWIYGFLVAYAWFRKVKPFTLAAFLVLGGYLLVNVAITFGFLTERLFLSKRYLIALSLVLMLWVPFALSYLMQRGESARHRLLLVVAAGFILMSAAGGIIDFGHSKAYIHEAGDWLADNVPKKAKLYANDYQLMYYSQAFGTSIFARSPGQDLEGIANNQWKQYDYLALRLSKKNESKVEAIVATISLMPVQQFSNKRGDKVIIYKVHEERQ